MDISAYIASGVLENYCLGLATEKEQQEVEHYAKIYPEINEELIEINESLELYALENGIDPRAAAKIKLWLSVYELESGAGKKYPPLITEDTTAADFEQWIAANEVAEPATAFDNLAIAELPSTEAVTNFMVWAKQGHQEEEHAEFNEFVVILKGHCDMYFSGAKKHYNTGDIIVIPPNIPHSAVITSDEPMMAVVQRQLIAA